MRHPDWLPRGTAARTPRTPVAAAPVAAAWLLAACASSAAAAPVLVECDVLPNGGRSLLVEASEGVGVGARVTDGSTVLIEVADPSPSGLRAGDLPCSAARVQVVPGSVMGTGTTRLLVRHRGPAPRIVEGGHRVRVLWLPALQAPEAQARAPERPVAPPPDRQPSAPPPLVAETLETPVDARPEFGGTAASAAAVAAAPSGPAPSPPRAAEPASSGVVEPSLMGVDLEAPTSSTARTRPRAGGDAEVAPRSVIASGPGSAPRDPDLPPDFLGLARPAPMAATLDTEVRSGPGRRHAVVRRVAAGETVTVDGRAGDWLRVGSSGWIFGAYFEPPAELEQGSFLARVEAVSAPVHAGPGQQHEIVAELYRGEQVAIDEIESGWAHVRNGGWVPESSIARIDAAR